MQKLTAKEREWVRQLLLKLQSGQTAGLDIKKLKGRDDIFRVRKGKIRIIYRSDEGGRLFVLLIERRNETTYKIWTSFLKEAVDVKHLQSYENRPSLFMSK